MGVTDVDPFIMGLTQTAGVTHAAGRRRRRRGRRHRQQQPLKGVYAFAFSDRATGTRGLAALATLALVGLLPLLVLAR